MFDGVKVDEYCKEQLIKVKSRQIKACNFKLTQNCREIIVDEGSEIPVNTPNAWKQWSSSLPEDACRYA